MAAAVDPLIGAKIDRYQVERQIGAGGMGRVYLARQPEIGARVAIKVVNAVDPEEREEWSQRLFAEARAVNLIGHENIVNVLDMVRLEDGRPALVMEYLNGVSLDRLIHESGKPLPLGMVADVVLDVLSAIGAAHRAGILHRDLKPANVFVTPEGRAKVLDFGIAKAVSGQTFRRGLQTQVGKVLGTAVYMAPEQARGQPIDERADLFAVGLILYEAATRRRAIRGPTLGQVLEQQGEPFVPASEYRAEVTEALDAVLTRALQPLAPDRYKTAGEMAAALRAATTPSLSRAGRTELTAALASTGRIELQAPIDPPPVIEEITSVETDGPTTPTAPTKPFRDRSADDEPPRRAARSLVAAALGVSAAIAATLLILRADASIPLELPTKPVEATGDGPTVDAAAAPAPLVARYRRGDEIAAARALAARALPDAELGAFAIAGAFTEEGYRLDRTELRLFSPARAASRERPCAMRVVGESERMAGELDERTDCAGDAAIDPPRCTGSEILTEGWLRAGERAVDAVRAELEGDHWVFSIDGARLIVPDDCGRPRHRRPEPEPEPPPPRVDPDSVIDPFQK